jgi:hypothetical protein
MGIHQSAMSVLKQPLSPSHFLVSNHAARSSWDYGQPQETLAQDDLKLQNTITWRQPVIFQLQL